MYKYFKKYLFLTLFITLSYLFSSNHVSAKESFLDKSELSKGIVVVNYEAETSRLMKVMISKGNRVYTYALDSNNRFPLQFGNGNYVVSVLENVKDTKYRLVDKETIELSLSNQMDVYLQSTQIINWNKKMDAIIQTKKLVKCKKTDLDKVKVIYNYIVENLKYDKLKAKSVTSGYLSSVEDTFESNRGICYDYAVLFAAMLRSIDIPTKLVMGNKKDLDGYHAWNQVYLRETKEWITIDTTYDAGLYKTKKVNMIKDSDDYTIKMFY